MKSENARKVLFKFDDIAKELDVKYYLGQGTALGFYRDGDFIGDDVDIDIIVDCEKNELNCLFDKMAEEGFRLEECHCNVFDEGYDLSRHTKYDGLLFDITFKPEILRVKFLKGSDTIIYHERTFNLPSPVEEYLECEFGEWRKKSDWRSRGTSKTLHPYKIGKSISFKFEDYMKYG